MKTRLSTSQDVGEEPMEPRGGCAGAWLHRHGPSSEGNRTRGVQQLLQLFLTAANPLLHAQPVMSTQQHEYVLLLCPQVANRPFRFLRIVRVIRYVRGLRTLASTIVAAIPATLQVICCETPLHQSRCIAAAATPMPSASKHDLCSLAAAFGDCTIYLSSPRMGMSPTT